MGNYLNLLLDYIERYPEIFLLLFLSVLDVVSGILAAKATHSISSNTGYRGIIKKTFMWIVVAMASAINLYQPIIPLRIIACGGFCIVECMSIIENAGRAGVKLPLPLMRAFKLLDFLYQQKVSEALNAFGDTGAGETVQPQTQHSTATGISAAANPVQQVMVMTPEQLQDIIEKMLGNYAPVTPKESAAIAEVVTNQTARRYGSGELKIRDRDDGHTGNNQSE